MQKRQIFVLWMIIFFIGHSYAHEGHHHDTKNTSDDKIKLASASEKLSLQKINLSYKQNVKSIFVEKCMNCHSAEVNYPFYYFLPLVSNLIDSDISESKKHIDMTNDFPFFGHGTPREDLVAIRKVTEEGSMPPLRYRILHWGSKLSDDEKNKIISWTNVSEQILKEPGR